MAEKKDDKCKARVVNKVELKFDVTSKIVGDRVSLTIDLGDTTLDFDLPADSRAARYLAEKEIIK